jgi:hypothetical protein
VIVSRRLRSAADVDAWLERAGRAAATVELLWRGARGLQILAPLAVAVAGRERELDLALLELNAGLVDAGVWRGPDGVVAGCVAFPDHDGALAPESVERAIAATLEAHAAARARLGGSG